MWHSVTTGDHLTHQLALSPGSVSCWCLQDSQDLLYHSSYIMHLLHGLYFKLGKTDHQYEGMCPKITQMYHVICSTTLTTTTEKFTCQVDMQISCNIY